MDSCIPWPFSRLLLASVNQEQSLTAANKRHQHFYLLVFRWQQRNIATPDGFTGTVRPSACAKSTKLTPSWPGVSLLASGNRNKQPIKTGLLAISSEARDYDRENCRSNSCNNDNQMFPYCRAERLIVQGVTYLCVETRQTGLMVLF